MKRTVMILGLVIGMLLPAAGEAQEDWERPGFWVAGGGGFGSSKSDCARCSLPRHGSFAFLVGMGGSASEKVRFGIEGAAWFQAGSDTSREYLAALALAQFFPLETLPLSVQVGVGGGRYAEQGGGDILEAFGFALSVGAAYDFRFARGLDARLFTRYLFSNGLTTRINRQVQFTDLNFNMMYVGLGLVWTKY